MNIRAVFFFSTQFFFSSAVQLSFLAEGGTELHLWYCSDIMYGSNVEGKVKHLVWKKNVCLFRATILQCRCVCPRLAENVSTHKPPQAHTAVVMCIAVEFSQRWSSPCLELLCILSLSVMDCIKCHKPPHGIPTSLLIWSSVLTLASYAFLLKSSELSKTAKTSVLH